MNNHTSSHHYQQLMQAALNQARLAMGHSGNNPPVGCVIALHGKIIAEGHTQPNGCHAEIHALRQVPPKTHRQSEIFITLEPCCFQGRTPPCTQALIQAAPQCIVIAHRDPHPKVRGAGTAILRQANITVIEGVLKQQTAIILKPWLEQFPPVETPTDILD